MSKICLDILDPERKKVFDRLVSFREQGLLVGGTGLGLQLGHRRSFDFDVFLFKIITPRFLGKVIRVFGKEVITRISNQELLMMQTRGGVEIHFVYFERQNLYPPMKTDSIGLAAIGDIAADKAYTIGKRGAWRDYVDLFFLLKRKYLTLEEIIRDAKRKYQPEFNPRLFLEQLSYFGDITDFSISFLEESYSVEAIKNFLTKSVAGFKLI